MIFFVGTLNAGAISSASCWCMPWQMTDWKALVKDPGERPDRYPVVVLLARVLGSSELALSGGP